jgi:hypothetical protein
MFAAIPTAKPKSAMLIARAGNHVIERLDLGARRHPQEVRGKEGRFQHVVAPERVIGVRNIVLAKRHIDAGGEELLHSGMQRTGVRIAHDCDPRAPHKLD